ERQGEHPCRKADLHCADHQRCCIDSAVRASAGDRPGQTRVECSPHERRVLRLIDCSLTEWWGTHFQFWGVPAPRQSEAATASAVYGKLAASPTTKSLPLQLMS